LNQISAKIYHDGLNPMHNPDRYHRVWRAAESGLYTPERLVEEFGDDANFHRQAVANARYSAAHPVMCKCKTGNLAASKRNPGLKLSLG